MQKKYDKLCTVIICRFSSKLTCIWTNWYILFTNTGCTAAACSRIICYTTLGLLVAMGVATIPSLRYAPKTSNGVSPPSVKANDTVELSFSLPSAWIHKLSLSVGSMCNGTVYTHRGKCSSLYTNTRVCYRTSRVRPPVYLLPDSHLNFTIAANFSSQQKVWITSNPDYFNYQFPATSCDDPPPHTHCLHPQTNQKETTHLVFNVTEPAYYTPYMSSWRDILNLEYNVCSYNVSKLSEIAEPQEPIQSDLVDIDILYKPFTYKDICTIFHVKNENRDCTYNVDGGQLTAEVTRRQDVLLFAGLLVGVAVLVLIGVIITHFIICRRRRSAQQRYQALYNVEEQV